MFLSTFNKHSHFINGAHAFVSLSLSLSLAAHPYTSIGVWFCVCKKHLVAFCLSKEKLVNVLEHQVPHKVPQSMSLVLKGRLSRQRKEKKKLWVSGVEPRSYSFARRGFR